MIAGAELVSAGLADCDDLVRSTDRPSVAIRKCCDPKLNPIAAHFFITRCCYTLDEDDARLGQVERIRGEWPFVLDYISWLEGLRADRVNGLVDKSRRMLGTWVATAWFLWRAMWTNGFPAFMTSGRGEPFVDDGGENSTIKSLFGRMRFMYERIPYDEARRSMAFAWKRGVCEETNAYITGEAPKDDGGRSGGFVAALVDEVAFAPRSEALNRALDPACRNGKLYITTHNGPSTVAARFVRKRPAGWRILWLDWSQHPELNQGLTATPENEIERYGGRVSPAFRKITSGLRDEDIAQEYNHSIDRSLKGLVYKEFNLRRHVPEQPLAIDHARPVYVGVDYGSTGFGAAVIGQPTKDGRVRVLADYELENAGGARVHALNIAEILASPGVGFRGELGEVAVVGGPDTETRQSASGQSNAGYFRVVGFHGIREASLHGAGSVDRGITVVCDTLRWDRIEISPACERLIAAFGEYHWPTDRHSGERLHSRNVAPIHDDASHIMDAFRYLVTELREIEDATCAEDTFAQIAAPQRPGDNIELPPDEDDGLYPSWHRGRMAGVARMGGSL